MDHSYELTTAKEEIIELPTDLLDGEEEVEQTETEIPVIEEDIEMPVAAETILEECDDLDRPDGERQAKHGPFNFYTKLIDLVRSYPNIYDKFDPGFKSPLEREKSWTEIANTLKTSVGFAQNRWIRLRERFAREKKALEIMQQTGNINERKRLWPYFLPMFFLSSHIKPRKSLTSTPEPAADTLSGPMTVSKFLSSMGSKLSIPSTSSLSPRKDIEVIDDHHPDYVAWRKRKPDTTTNVLQPPRKIMAKPEGSSVTTVLFTTKGKDGENKILTKLPPGAVLLKNPPGSMGSSPVVLVPTTPPHGINLGKSNPMPLILSTAQQPTFSQVNCEPSPTPNSAEHHFGMLIARELERFPKEVRAKKKQRILMVLYE